MEVTYYAHFPLARSSVDSTLVRPPTAALTRKGRLGGGIKSPLKPNIRKEKDHVSLDDVSISD